MLGFGPIQDSKIGLSQVVALLAAVSLAIIMNDGNANGIIKGVLLIF